MIRVSGLYVTARSSQQVSRTRTVMDTQQDSLFFKLGLLVTERWGVY
jgi:hypothetical protein